MTIGELSCLFGRALGSLTIGLSLILLWRHETRGGLELLRRTVSLDVITLWIVAGASLLVTDFTFRRASARGDTSWGFRLDVS